jgi:hypothetical protein
MAITFLVQKIRGIVVTGSGAERNIYGSATLNKHFKKVPHQVIIRLTPLFGSMPIGRAAHHL